MSTITKQDHATLALYQREYQSSKEELVGVEGEKEEVLDHLHHQFVVSLDSGSNCLQKFQSNMEMADKKLEEVTFKLIDEMSPESNIEKVLQISEFCQSNIAKLKEQYKQSLRLQMEFSQIQTSSDAIKCREVFDTISHIQSKALCIAVKKMEILHQEDLHTLDVAVKQHELRLKEQNADMERTITIAKHNADLEVKKTEERRIDLEHKASLRQKEELYQHQIEMDKKDQERKNQELIQRHELRLKEIQSKETSDLSCSVQ